MFDGEIQGYQSEGGASEFSKLTDDEYFGGYFPEEDDMTGGATSTGEFGDDKPLTKLINTFNPFNIMSITDNDYELQKNYYEKISKIVYEKLNSINNDSDKKVPYFFALINDIIVSSLFFLQTTFGDEYKKLINFKTNTDDISDNLTSILTFLSDYKKYLGTKPDNSPDNSPVLDTIDVLIEQIGNSNEINLEPNDIEELVKETVKSLDAREQKETSNLKELMIAKISSLLNHSEGTDNPIHPKTDTEEAKQEVARVPDEVHGGVQESKSPNDPPNLIELTGTNFDDETPSQSTSMPTGNASSGPQQSPRTEVTANKEEQDDDDSFDSDSSDDGIDDQDPTIELRVGDKNEKRALAREAKAKAKAAAREAEAKAKAAARELAQPAEPSEALNELAEAEDKNASTTTASHKVEPFAEVAPNELH